MRWEKTRGQEKKNCFQLGKRRSRWLQSGAITFQIWQFLPLPLTSGTKEQVASFLLPTSAIHRNKINPRAHFRAENLIKPSQPRRGLPRAHLYGKQQRTFKSSRRRECTQQRVKIATAVERGKEKKGLIPWQKVFSYTFTFYPSLWEELSNDVGEAKRFTWGRRD